MDEKNTKAETNKYAELRRTQYEIDTVVIDGKTFTVINAFPTDTDVTVIDGKTFTVINAFPTDTDVTVEDRLRYLVKVS